jgi:hypothetical protein
MSCESASHDDQERLPYTHWNFFFFFQVYCTDTETLEVTTVYCVVSCTLFPTPMPAMMNKNVCHTHDETLTKGDVPYPMWV